MFHDIRNVEAASFQPGETPFRIVTIYDSSEGSMEAAKASAIVTRELGDDVMVDRSSWELCAFSKPETRGFAAAVASRADLIVIAISTDEPSRELKEWVNAWEKNRQLSNGLLALIPSGDSADHTLEDFLYEAAVTANMDFLCRKPRRFQ